MTIQRINHYTLAAPGGHCSHVVVAAGLIALVEQSPWRGEVTVVEPTGADTFVVVKTGAGDVTVRTSPQA